MSARSEFVEAAASVAERMRRGPMIRAVNFHNTPQSRAAEFERQLEHWGQGFAPVTEDALDGYLATGRWDSPRPGLIVAVYEGYRNGFDVFLPLLDRHGLIGWFFVITGFVQAPPEQQLTFAADHDIGMATREYDDGRYALSWEELRTIDRRHVVASHARSHVDLASLDGAQRESEIMGAQKDFEEHLGHPVRSFVSYGGPAYGTDAVTDRLVDRAGYQFVFSNLKIQRLRGWGGS